MFTFQEFCVSETSSYDASYYWSFDLPIVLLEKLTPEEKSIIYIEQLPDYANGHKNRCVRCWYPEEKFWNRYMTTEEFSKLVNEAIETNNTEMLKHLREKSKEMK